LTNRYRGPGDKSEYEELKKINPSYKNKFDLIDFVNEVYIDVGILVNVKRISDKKVFTLLKDAGIKKRTREVE
jgi:hypothetical protein